MEIFNVGGPELILLIFLAGVLLGPRRMVLMARELGNIMRQIKLVSRSLTKELNREIDLLDREMRLAPPEGQAEEPASPDVELTASDPLPDQVETPETMGAAMGESPSNGNSATQPAEAGESPRLPEAYQRFIEDFPDEALKELPGRSAASAHSN
jgi:Sec-independent protein translocase protein TatA